MKRMRLWLALLSAAAILSGCAHDSGAEAPEDDSYDFVFVCPFLDNEYWGACIEGIREADAELGTHTRILGSNDFEHYSTEIVKYMEEAVASDPDGILAYAGLEGMYPLIERADEQGIPFIAIDSDAPATSRIAYVGTVSYNSGYQAGETLVQLTGGEAVIGVLVSSLDADKEMEVVGAFRDSIADYDMEIVAIDVTDADPAVAAERAKAMLTQYPEITALFNTAGYNVTGAARAKKDLGLDELILIGFDDVEETLAYIREGVINAVLVQSPKQMGYQGVYLLKQYLDTGRLPQSIYDTGTTLVTQENVDSYKE